jgi:hypothetical protein
LRDPLPDEQAIDSDHDNPIFPDLSRDRIVDGPNQLWVADITYIAIATGFVYLAAILDAWSRRVVGYAISRSIDARVAVAALTVCGRTWRLVHWPSFCLGFWGGRDVVNRR